jgi:hypothetical protein
MRTQNSEKNLANTPNPTTLPELLWLLIGTKQGWIGIAGVTAILTTAILIAMQFMRPDKIDISTAVGSISIKKGSTQNALLSLSPNGGDEDTPWVKTGITVKTGDQVKITASGRVNTSIKRVVAETIKPEVDERTWVSPSGLDFSDNTTYFPGLDRFLLLPSKNGAYYGFGMLLATVRDSNGQTKNIAPFKPLSQNDDFIEFTAKNDGELVLTVNDIWLSGDLKNAYIPPWNDDSIKHYLQLAEFEAAFKGEDFKSWSEETQRKKAEAQYQRRLKGWDSIISKGNWNIWYDDNIGSFSVSITVNEKD